MKNLIQILIETNYHHQIHTKISTFNPLLLDCYLKHLIKTIELRNSEWDKSIFQLIFKKHF